METMQNILTRRSVRKFADKPIEPDKLHTILEAAMSGPCACLLYTSDAADE